MSDQENLLVNTISSDSFDLPPSHIAKPPLLKTWLRIFIGFIGCTLASGVLTSYPTLTGMFVEHGIFNQGCEDFDVGKCPSQNNTMQLLYYVATGVSVGLVLIAGQVFDILGARLVAIIGAIGVMIGSYLMYLAVSYKSIENLLWLAVPMIDLFGFLNSYALLGFMFHDEPRQAIIMGVANGSYTASSVMMNVLVALNQAGWAFPNLFVFQGACAFVAAVLCATVLATQEEYFEQAERVTTVRPEKVKLRPLHAFRNALRVYAKHPFLNFVFVCATVMPYIAVVFWAGSVFEYLTFAIGEQASQSYAVTFAIMLTVMSSAMAPVAGVVFEWIGMIRFIALLGAVQITLWLSTIVSTSDFAILLSFASADTLLAAWQLMVLKWCVTFAPPDLVGSFFGALFSVAGLSQLGVNFAVPPIMQAALGTTASASAYWYSYLILGALASLALVVLSITAAVRTLPKVPPTLKDRDRPLCSCIASSK